MRLIRVFPRRTHATPRDELVYCGGPDLFAEADEVHVSVTFTWDLPRAEQLAGIWTRAHIAPVVLGGPALGRPGGEFVPGRYLRTGYVITSRGCPNRCRYCVVPSREGPLGELPITEGWIVQDDNLLACSEPHLRAVFEMLARQGRPAVFAGGLDAGRLNDFHLGLLADLRPRPKVFFAYDHPAALAPLMRAGARLKEIGYTREGHRMLAYVLAGYPGDTIAVAETRMREAIAAGFMPFGMLLRDAEGKADPAWAAFQRRWARPRIVGAAMRNLKASWRL